MEVVSVSCVFVLLVLVLYILNTNTYAIRNGVIDLDLGLRFMVQYIPFRNWIWFGTGLLFAMSILLLLMLFCVDERVA
jgi:hypothetical protein